MTLTISGRIESTDSDSTALGECRVEVFFEQKAPATSDLRRLSAAVEGGTHESAPGAERTERGRVSARTDAQGRFTVSLPGPFADEKAMLHFAVSGPAGQLIGTAAHAVYEITDKLVIPVTTKNITSIPLTVPEHLPITMTRRITGRVFNRDGRPIPANSPVMLFAREHGDHGADGTGVPVLVARTDGSGYFFGEAPNHAYEAVVAVVTGMSSTITLDEGRIPEKLIIIVDVPRDTEAGPKAEGCGCGVTPRTPSHADIENSPDTYSTDLGTGRCIDFNTPNRAIEEFDFYTVIRTTEPDIVGFTTAEATNGGSSRSSEVLAALTAAVETATGAVTVARQKAEAAGLAASQTQAAAAEIQPLSAAFTAVANNPNGWIKQVVENALTEKVTGTWVEAKTRNELIALLTGAEHLSPTMATHIAGTLVDGIVAVPLSELDEKNYTGTFSRAHYAADRIVYSAAQAARTAAVSADSVAAAGNSAAAAANVALTEALNALNAARAAETTKRNELARQAQVQDRKAQSKPRGRERLNAKNPVDWDDTPTFYQAAEIAHGHLLHFKQVWYADGYSLGDLLYSLPLAPGQKKLISVVDWERRERTQRSEDTVSTEGVQAALSRDRDLGEVVTGALSESSRGGSRSTSAGVGMGTGAAGNGSYQGFNFGALIGVSGGYGESNSSAWQDSSRNLASSSLQNLRDRTLQSASAIRGLRSSVVHTVAQGEAVRATTEVVANHNHCHAMTVQYFEVLRHLKLQHELAGVQECLFVPLPMSEFDLAKTLRWRQELRTYLQHPHLGGGFDAARRVSTSWSEVDSPLERYADEYVVSLTGELLLTVHIPLPPFPERPKPRPEDTAAAAAQAVADAVNPTTGVLGVFLAIATGGASLIAGAATSGGIRAAQAAAAGARSIADSLYTETPQERYNRFHRDIVPGVVEAFIDHLELWALVDGKPVQLQDVDFTLASEYQPGIPLLVSLRATLEAKQRRSKITQLMIKSAMPLAPNCRAIVNTATIRYRTSSFEHALVSDGKVNDDIDPPKAVALFTGLADYDIKILSMGNGATLFTPLDAWEQRSPRTEDRRLAAELVDHLNDNLEYYHHAIWWTMDPNRRYMLLDGYYAPGSHNRSVASVVENRLIGIVGNSIVLPVASGIHLDPRFTPRAAGSPVDLLDFYRPETPVPAVRVSLPTPGIFAEAVMGACNSCEKIDDSRFWRWEESPIDEPPAIEPVSMGTRRNEPGPTQPTSFPAPIVSIQNAPGVPDPAGVRAALDALGKQSFADITGLAGTQANAAAAYQQALDTAFKFGKEASTLAQQAAMLKSIDKSMDSIDKADAEGKIDPAQAKKLRTTALEKLVGKPSESLTPADVAERVKMIDDMKANSSITANDAQALNKAALRSLLGESRADQVAAADLASELDPDQIASITSGEGPTVIRTGLDSSADRIAPTHIRGLSGLGTQSGDGTSTTNQLWSGAKSLFEAVADGVADWKDAPHKELTDAVAESIKSAALAAADDTTDKIPLVKAMKIAVKLSLVFADGVGTALTRTNAALAGSYRAGELAGGGGDGLTPEDVAAIQSIRRWQLTSVQKVNGILVSGIEAVVERLLTDALTWASDSAVKAASGVAKQLVGHYLTQRGAQAMLAGALSELRAGVPIDRQPFYKELVTTVVGLYVRQLDNATLRSDLAPLAKLGTDKPLEKMLLSTLASLLVDPVARRISSGMRKTIAAKAKVLMAELRTAGLTVTAGAGMDAGTGGVTLPRTALIEIENGPEAAEAEADHEVDEFTATLGRLQKGAIALASTAGRMRQRGLVSAKQRDDEEAYANIWSRYIDDLKDIGFDLNRAAIHLLAGVTGTVQERASVWISSYLRFPRLVWEDPARWQQVEYVPKTGGLQPTGMSATGEMI